MEHTLQELVNLLVGAASYVEDMIAADVTDENKLNNRKLALWVIQRCAEVQMELALRIENGELN